MNIVVVGAQWGDEGKGKLIDFLSQQLDITARFQGGNNAGHTVVVGDEEYIFHLIPSAILHREKTCVIGNGVVIDPKELLGELDGLKKRGIDVAGDQLKISAHAHVVMPYHRVLDGLRESKRENKIGTTGRGIGPCYADKVARCGIRIVDLVNPNVLERKLKDNLKEKNEVFVKAYQHQEYSFDEIYKEYLEYGEKLEPYIADTALFLNRAIDLGKTVLFEGAQGAFLDIDFGTYPFVTSSNCIVGGACPGTGVPPTKVNKSLAVVKAYTTRVGEGPFPTELEPEHNEEFRKKGNEFGATTGRPRRCGWFDSVLVKYSTTINGADEIAVMKLDVLDGMETLKICTGYKYNGEVLTDFPADFDALTGAEPVYEELPGWTEPSQGAQDYDKLPENAKKYIARLEELLGVKVKYISTGSKRSEIIIR